MSPKEVTDKFAEQIFKQNSVSGLDVIVWISRHVGWLIMIGAVISAGASVAWKGYFKNEVACVAKQLDAVILVRVDENRKISRDAYYKVSKVEYILDKTAPKKVVKEADEWIELEKWRID